MTDAHEPAWAPHDLETVHAAEEVQVASNRPDGSERPPATIWGVRVGDDVYVRSAYGPDNGWYRRALRSGTGRFVAGDVDAPATFTHIDPADAATQDAVSEAFRAKYAHFGPRYVDAMVSEPARQSTLRVAPR